MINRYFRTTETNNQIHTEQSQFMKKTFLLFALFTFLSTIQNRAAAQTAEASKAEDPAKTNYQLSREIDELRHRVDELESQNRALAELLKTINARLVAPEARVQPVAASLPNVSASTEMTAAKPAAAFNPESPAAKKPAQTESAKSKPVYWSDLIGTENQIKLYGFLRMDLDYDSQRANVDQSPLFITSADPR